MTTILSWIATGLIAALVIGGIIAALYIVALARSFGGR